MDKHLHIISLDVPYPVDYGGVYDLFYKLPTLQAEGVKIHLHCFENGRGEQEELNKYCQEVFYYRRNSTYKFFSNKLPYIVASRVSEVLHRNLLKDDFPIFMEGVHCTYPLLDERFSKRKKFVRVHNVEHRYYQQLFAHTENPIKKIYYWKESKLLLQYEKDIAKKATAYWAVSKNDVDFYHDQLDCRDISYVPLFLPKWKVQCSEGVGNFCLYHGNLSVAENEYAVKWLLKNVFNTVQIPFVVAGKNPSVRLHDFMRAHSNACLVTNPGENEMQDLIARAHINILPSFNNTGIKIKLVNALYHGRHCLVNDAMVAGNSLGQLCHIANSAEAFKQKIEQLYHQRFTQEETAMRSNILYGEFNNETNAKQLVKWIWETYV